MKNTHTSLTFLLLLLISPSLVGADEPISIGSRLELFVDDHVIERLVGSELRLHRPESAGVALKLDRPWEGELCGYFTVLKDGDAYRMYYRGRPLTGYGDAQPEALEVTCLAESSDGKSWRRPNLGIYKIAGTKDNNVILADVGPMTHNFAPFIDKRPGVSKTERYKAVGGTSRTGLILFYSADGIRWRKLREAPIIVGGAFDSQNNVFWSDHEQRYVCFYRTFRNKVRWITRTTSLDLINWTPAVDMSFGDAPNEHLYTNQTEAYYRAPHIYIGTAARFWPGRQALTDAQVEAIQLDGPKNYDNLKSGCSDGVLLTSRGGNVYDRMFLESLDRPGTDLRNWTARSNYPARGVVPTGPQEMSMYVQRHYGQPTGFVERMRSRIDGFVSVHAGYRGGELLTKPIVFAGTKLIINVATSAAGSIAVEVQEASGKEIPGYTMADAKEIVGDGIARVVEWQAGSDVSQLQGRAVRLRFRLKDADLYSFRFGG